MSRPASQAYIDVRETDPEFEEITERIDALGDPPPEDDHEHEEGDEHGHEGPGIVDPKTPLWAQLWLAVNNPTKLLPNASAALYDAARNAGDTVLDTIDTMAAAGIEGRDEDDPTAEQQERSERRTARKTSGPVEQKPLTESVVDAFPEFFGAMDAVRDDLRKDSTSGDVMVQKTLQFAAPFTALMKMVGFANTATTAGKIGKAVLVDAVTNATVWDPHETRFGDLLIQFAPENTQALLAPFTNYVMADEDETEWEGRWKNTVDSFVLNAALTPVIAGVIKAGGAMIRKGHKIVHLSDADAKAKAIDEWLSSRPKGPGQTIEIFSAKSDAGRHINAARDLAGKVPGEADVLEREVLAAQTAGMARAQELGAFSKLAHAITGRHHELVRTEIPTAGRPFDYSGTYEGGLTTNARVPLTGMSDDELKQMNAAIGDSWDQDAMVASEIVPSSWDAAVPAGFTRGATLVIAGEKDAAKLALRVRAAVPPEHEFSVHAIGEDSFAVDIFPAFGDAGPVGVGKDTTLRIINELGDNVDAVAHDFRSVYTTRDEYADILGSMKLGQATDIGRSSEYGAETLDDLFAEARTGLRDARQVYESQAGQAVERLEDRVARQQGGGLDRPKTPEREAAQSAIDSMVPAAGLNERDRAVEAAAAAWVHASPERAYRQYTQLPDTDGGRILSVDSARELDPVYRNDRSLAPAVHEPFSALVKAMYELALGRAPRRGQEAMVLFSSGGTGAGKTSGLRETVQGMENKAQIVYDSNLQTFGSATQKIDRALEAGKKVVIAYTYRDPLEALDNGALDRAARQEAKLGSGRTIKLDEHLGTHLRSNEVIERLATNYRDNPAVKFVYIDNSHGKGKAHVWNDPEKIPSLKDLDYNELREKAVEIIERKRAAGEISDKIADAFLDSPASKSRPGTRQGAGGKPEPQRDAGSQGADRPASIDPAFGDTHAGSPHHADFMSRAGGEVGRPGKHPEHSEARKSVVADLRDFASTMDDEAAEGFLTGVVDDIKEALRSPKGTLAREVEDITEHRGQHERGAGGESVIERKVRERKEREARAKAGD